MPAREVGSRVLLERFSDAARSFLDEVRLGLWDPFRAAHRVGEGPTFDETRLGTFSPEVTRPAEWVHNRLEWIAAQDPMSGRSTRLCSLTPEQQYVLELYGQNSVPFHNYTRGISQPDYRPDFYPMDPVDYFTYFHGPDQGERASRLLSEALRALPPVRSSYNVENWTFAYEGRMSFRGAITSRLPFQGGDGGPVYCSPQDESNHDDFPPNQANVIRTGDIVTNPDFMSTSASGETAANFGSRQRERFIGPDNVQYIRANTDLWKSRTFLEIDFVSGRNISTHTREKQAEILFDRYKYFEVTRINVDEGIGTIASLREIERPDAGRVVRNVLTGAPVDLARQLH